MAGTGAGGPGAPRGPIFLGIDLGGTKVLALAADAAGAVLGRAVASTPADDGPDAIADALASAAAGALADGGVPGAPVRAFGIAAAGAIDIRSGTIVHSPHLPTASHMPVVAMLGERLGAPGVIGNDANLAALAEHRYGAGQDTDDLLFITVSTGIGGGIISRGKLLLGAEGYAGEIGHMTIDASGPLAKSTTPGAWEALCSGTALARIATERINAGEASSLAASLADTGTEALTARDVFAAYHLGDKLAQSVIADGVRHMAVALTSLVNILNPGKIIIGGGLSNQWDDYIAPAVTLMREQSFAGVGKATPVVLPALGADAGAYGAIALAREAADEGAI